MNILINIIKIMKLYFSFYKNNSNKYELIPVKVSDSNEKYKTELESIFNEKLKIRMNMKKCFDSQKIEELKIISHE